MRPTATAPPAGNVFATVVVVCVTTAERESWSPGSAAMFASQYVNRLKVVASSRDHVSIHVRSRSVSKTAP